MALRTTLLQWLLQAAYLLSTALLIAGANGNSKTTAPNSALRLDGELTWSDGSLRLVTESKSAILRPLQPVPYRIVSCGDYAVVTTCGSDLIPSTWTTDGQIITQCRGMLPLVVQLPIAALGGLPSDAHGIGSGVTLLGANGSVAWHDNGADLLWPLSGSPGSHAYCIRGSDDSDPVFVYGSRPRLIRVKCPEGKELWRVTLPAREAVVDSQLYALDGGKALLGLQYDYEEFAFFSLDLATGRTKLLKELIGVVASQGVYPGPLTMPTGVSVQGERVRLLVRDAQRGWRTWTFYLSDGTVTDTPGTPLDALTEDNPRPAVGRGAPSTSHPVYPQALLPLENGASWSIPALRNAQGQVLVVSYGKAKWVAP